MTKLYLKIILLGLIVGFAYYQSRQYITYQKATDRRSHYQEASKQDHIKVAVVWDQDGSSFFIKGAKAMVEMINNTEFISYATGPDTTVSKKIQLDFFYESSHEDIQKNAKAIGKNPTYAAVIGHNGSQASIPASISYEYNGIPYISPVATSNLLTQHNFNHVFRSAPTDNDFTNALIQFCHKRQYKNIAVIYCRDIYGVNFSNIFVESAAGLNSQSETELEPLNITIQKSFSPTQKIFLSLIADVVESKPDCIFIAGMLDQTGPLIRQIRQMGVRLPIIAGDGLDSSDLGEATGNLAGEIYVASVFDELLEVPKNSLYEEAKIRFEEIYSESPDYDASQGMEAIYILAQVFKITQSTNPLTITSFLRVYDKFEGITGPVSFSKDGNIIGKKVFIKEFVNGKFKKISN